MKNCLDLMDDVGICVHIYCSIIEYSHTMD
jgi:hypothetical protein